MLKWREKWRKSAEKQGEGGKFGGNFPEKKKNLGLMYRRYFSLKKAKKIPGTPAGFEPGPSHLYTPTEWAAGHR